jgi:segregation and condensation protein B
VAGGYRFQSHPDLAAYVERFVLEGQSARLSSAAMETLAIVAYKQPVSRAQVAAIRGVNVDGVMRTLQQRDLITEVSRDPGPGQAVLFGTTTSFLERLGLDSVDDLPPLGQFVPGADVFEALERGLRPESPEEVAAAAAAEAAQEDADRDADDDAAGPERYGTQGVTDPDHYGTAEAESVVDDQGHVDRTTLEGDEADISEGADEDPPLEEALDQATAEEVVAGFEAALADDGEAEAVLDDTTELVDEPDASTELQVPVVEDLVDVTDDDHDPSSDDADHEVPDVLPDDLDGMGGGPGGSADGPDDRT